MSNLNENDIAEWQKKQQKVFRVEEIDTFSFDDEGNQQDWKGYGVTLTTDPTNYCYLMRDKAEADKLCEFLNNECYIPDNSIDDYVLDNLTEWCNLLTELSYKEIELLKLKDLILDKEQWITENTDFKEIYGRNNVEVRKLHFSKHMKGEYDYRRNLELSIDYLKRRISYLKSLINVKSTLMEVSNDDS